MNITRIRFFDSNEVVDGGMVIDYTDDEGTRQRLNIYQEHSGQLCAAMDGLTNIELENVMVEFMNNIIIEEA